MHIFDPLYNAVSWVLLQFHLFWGAIFGSTSGDGWVAAIISLVVVVRICLIPLFVRQIKSQRNLNILQPQMKEIQRKYKNDKQKQQEELMKLYKETGTNPLASCLPLLVQSPFFLALYHVLSYVSRGIPVGVIKGPALVSAHNATFLGAPISATFAHAHDTNTRIVALVLIVLMTATTFTTQRQLMTKNMATNVDNPLANQQKLLLYVFPGMYAIFGLNFPIGVLIYWFTTNLWTMGQQFVVIRRSPTPGSPAFEARERRLAEKQARKDAAKEPQQLGVAGSEDGPPVTTEPPPPPRNQPKRQSRSQRRRPPNPETP